MTIEEQYKNALELFYICYQGSGRNTIKISSSTLQENGLGGKSFLEVICPKLAADGILKEYPTENLGVEFVDSGKAELLFSQINGVVLPLHDILGTHTEDFKRVEEVQKQLALLDRLYTFVVNEGKLRESYSIKTNLQVKVAASERAIVEPTTVLTKNSNGDYSFQGILINISKNTIYYDVFDILFSNRNQDGFLSYLDIERELLARNHPSSENEQKRNKRIQNAITNKQQGFFRNAKINKKPLNNTLRDGKKLIEIVRGKGLKLNNPVIVK